jgi:hypothetical protein
MGSRNGLEKLPDALHSGKLFQSPALLPAADGRGTPVLLYFTLREHSPNERQNVLYASANGVQVFHPEPWQIESWAEGALIVSIDGTHFSFFSMR